MGVTKRRFNTAMKQVDPEETLPPSQPRRELTPAARRALAEAEERRRQEMPENRPVEIGGPKGPEPVRYGDWEVKGRASDF